MWLTMYGSFLRARARARPGIFVDCARFFTLLGWRWPARAWRGRGQAEQFGKLGRAARPAQVVGALKGIRPHVAMRQRSPKQESCLLTCFSVVKMRLEPGGCLAMPIWICALSASRSYGRS